MAEDVFLAPQWREAWHRQDGYAELREPANELGVRTVDGQFYEKPALLVCRVKAGS